MRIAIIGAGNVGGTLGKMWAAKDHEVVFGVRRPNDANVQALLTATGKRARAASVKDAVTAAEVVVLVHDAGAEDDQDPVEQLEQLVQVLADQQYRGAAVAGGHRGKVEPEDRIRRDQHRDLLGSRATTTGRAPSVADLVYQNP
jgi:putative NADH-flavin reductase